MRWTKFASGSLLSALALSSVAFAQTPSPPTIEMISTSVNVGIGGQSGTGVLHLPNLGTNCSYPFRVSGFGAGIRVGISKQTATGIVANMTKVADLSGEYSATQGEATLIAGAGSTSMKNKANNVVIGLNGQTEGIGLGFGGQGMTVELAEPPVNGPRQYMLTFGFNKTNLNRDSRATLNQIAKAWKCHYGKILLFGNADTVGRETANLNLSQLRAAAAHDYLLQAGFEPTRVISEPVGESRPVIPTENNVRLRNNRNVVIVVQE